MVMLMLYIVQDQSVQNDEVADRNEDKSRNMIDHEPRIQKEVEDRNREEWMRMMKIWNLMKQLPCSTRYCVPGGYGVLWEITDGVFEDSRI